MDPKLTRFRAGGMNWVADSAFAAAVRDLIAQHLDNLEAAGAALVKRSLARSVHRLELDGRTVFVKHHRVRSLAERIKYLVIPSRGAVEWAVSRALAERGLPAARAVAFGERRVAGLFTEAVLVTEAVPDAVPLNEALRARPELLPQAAHLIRQMHDANVLHRDLHGGNILAAGKRLILIDLHNVAVGRPVSSHARAKSVAWFLAALGGRAGQRDRAAFVADYLPPDTAPADRDRFAQLVEGHVERFRERRYVSRTKRCIKTSAGFRRVSLCLELLRLPAQEGVRRGRHVRLRVHRRVDVPDELVQTAIARHAEARGEEVLKSDHRARVTAIELGPDSPVPRVCVKEFIRPALLQRIADFCSGSRAMRAWLGSNACAVRGIGTPKALAAADAGPRSYLITEYLDGARQLNDYVADHGRPGPGEPARRWHEFIAAAADFVRRLHSHRLYHRDLSAKNILVRQDDGRWRFWLLDTSDVRLGRAPALREKVYNLGQLDQIYVRPSRTDRLRFYRHYSRGRPEFDRRGLLAEIDAHSRARHDNWLRNGGGYAILEERRRQGKTV